MRERVWKALHTTLHARSHCRSESLVLEVVVDETRGGRVLALVVLLSPKDGKEALCEDFSELDAELIELVDGPNGTLGESPVLVQRNERTERSGRHLLDEHAVRRPASGEDLALHKEIVAAGLCAQLFLDFRLRLAKRKRFRLREKVGEEDRMVVLVSLSDGVERLRRRDEISGNNVCALMQHLVEAVLAVCAWLAEKHRRGVVVDALAVFGHLLSERFHLELLQVG